jgi:hypothetical protein
MRILVGCEFSGVVRRAFRAKGHYAWSCDLLPSADNSPYHIQGDVLDVLRRQPWDMGIFHPPCTFLTVAANAWLYHPDDKAMPPAERRPHPDYPNRWNDRADAIEFVRTLLQAPVKKLVLENPVGILPRNVGKWSQIIQPYNYGEDASKATCLWLKGLPLLQPTVHVPPRITAEGKKRWANQTDSGQNNLGPSDARWALRSATYPGIATAFADQWG